MLFGFDKLRAGAGHWRIAESTLLGFALLGGSLGALAGRRIFRHKTRKWYFQIGIPLLILQNLAALYVIRELVILD